LPCDSLRTTTIEFHPNNEAILYEVVKLLGWRVAKTQTGYQIDHGWGQIIIENGKATGDIDALNKLCDTYADTIIDRATVRTKLAGHQTQQLSGGFGQSTNKVKITLSQGKAKL
jgi:hypothetical protein